MQNNGRIDSTSSNKLLTFSTLLNTYWLIDMKENKEYKTLMEFYPYYLTEHSNFTNRVLHFFGTGIVISLLIFGIVSQHYKLLFFMPLAGYGFAWVGHFMIEKNKPATFKYPFFSLASDFIMFWHILTFQITKKLEDAKKIKK